jgi:hypothetical protein
MMLTQTVQPNPETCYERRNQGNGLFPALQKRVAKFSSEQEPAHTRKPHPVVTSVSY